MNNSKKNIPQLMTNLQPVQTIPEEARNSSHYSSIPEDEPKSEQIELALEASKEEKKSEFVL